MKHLKKFENYSSNISEEISLKSIGQKIGVIKDPIKEREKVMTRISNHRTMKSIYDKLLIEDKPKAEKYVQFWMKNPDAKYCKWDDAKKQFLDSGISRDPSGILGSRALERKNYQSKSSKKRI